MKSSLWQCLFLASFASWAAYLGLRQNWQVDQALVPYTFSPGEHREVSSHIPLLMHIFFVAGIVFTILLLLALVLRWRQRPSSTPPA